MNSVRATLTAVVGDKVYKYVVDWDDINVVAVDGQPDPSDLYFDGELEAGVDPKWSVTVDQNPAVSSHVDWCEELNTFFSFYTLQEAMAGK